MEKPKKKKKEAPYVDRKHFFHCICVPYLTMVVNHELCIHMYLPT